MSAALQRLLADPDGARRALEQLDAEERLINFMTLGWHALEPGTPFVRGWAVEAICEHLEAVTTGQIRRLLINVPPGFSKSMSTNVFWPMWEWGPRDLPHHRFISAAHEKDLSVRDNVRSRDLASSEWYQSRWGSRWQFKGDQNAKIRYENNHAGWRMASSTGAGLTGHRGDRILLDDPHAVRDMESEALREEALRWFSETLPTRLNRQGESAIVVIMQRVHDRDVSGLILKQDLGYEHLCLPMEHEPRHRCFTTVPREGVDPAKVRRLRRDGEPLPRWLTAQEVAEELERSPLGPEDYLGPERELTPQDRREEEGELLWPERFTAESVEELKRTFRSWGGTYAEAGQLQQRPAPREGGMFQRSDFQVLDHRPEGVSWVRGWDLASSKDKRAAWTVGCLMGLWKDRVVIADVRRLRGRPGEVEEALLTCAREDPRGTTISVPQDPGQAGVAQKAAYAKLLMGHAVHFSPESGSKEDRARPLAAQAEAGNLYLVRGPWNEAFVNEASLFPNGEYVDQVDAASRAFARLNRPRPSSSLAAPRLIGG